MSLPVDYWDYLGWKDTLALHGHSNRERAYADARGDREVYTPQVVVNGVVACGGQRQGRHRAGDRRRRAKRRAADAAGDDDGCRRQSDGERAGAAKDQAQRAEVWLCPITGKAQVEINRGENRGHTLAYYNVVRRWVKLGDWSGKAETFSVPVGQSAGCGFFVAGHRSQ